MNLSPANPAQQATIQGEIDRMAASLGRQPATVSVYVSVYADDRPGTVGFTISDPGVKADRSDWSMSASTLNTDGSHWDTDPVKPWELA